MAHLPLPPSAASVCTNIYINFFIPFGFPATKTCIQIRVLSLSYPLNFALPSPPLPLSKVALLFRFWLWENLCMRFMATWLVNKKNVAAPLENRIYLVHMWGKVGRDVVGGVRVWACQGLRAKGSWKVAKATQHLLLRCKVMPQFIKLRCSLPPTLSPILISNRNSKIFKLQLLGNSKVFKLPIWSVHKLGNLIRLGELNHWNYFSHISHTSHTLGEWDLVRILVKICLNNLTNLMLDHMFITGKHSWENIFNIPHVLLLDVDKVSNRISTGM